MSEIIVQKITTPLDSQLEVSDATQCSSDLTVLGNLFGAAKDENGNNLHIHCGKTEPGNTNWIAVDDALLRVNIDISRCNFNNIPIIISNLHGDTSHWNVKGGSCPYYITKTGFTIFIDRFALTPETVNSNYKWYIQWIAIGQ